MKWTKGNYKIDCKEKIEVEGSVCGQWGIDKRDGRYILTHIPTGYFVESAKTMKFLKDLVATPEFENFPTDPTPLAEAITRFRSEYGWTK